MGVAVVAGGALGGGGVRSRAAVAVLVELVERLLLGRRRRGAVGVRLGAGGVGVARASVGVGSLVVVLVFGGFL